MINVDRYVKNIEIPPIGKGNLFNGDHIAHINGKAATPKITGYAVATWIHLPPWLDSTFPWYREAFEKNIISFGGLSDIAINMIEINGPGFSGHPTTVFGNMPKGNSEITVGFKEFARDPMKKVYELWLRMVRDLDSNICNYSNVDWGTGRSYRPKPENEEGALLFATLEPDVINVDTADLKESSIRRAFVWSNLKPTTILFGDDNYTAGTVDQVESEMPFSGNFHIGEDIDELAGLYLRDHSLIRELREGTSKLNPANFRIGGPVGLGAT